MFWGNSASPRASSVVATKNSLTVVPTLSGAPFRVPIPTDAANATAKWGDRKKEEVLPVLVVVPCTGPGPGPAHTREPKTSKPASPHARGELNLEKINLLSSNKNETVIHTYCIYSKLYIQCHPLALTPSGISSRPAVTNLREIRHV